MNITKKIDTETMKGKIVFAMLPYQRRVELVKQVYLSDKSDEGVEKELGIGVRINELVAEQVKFVEIKYKDSEMEIDIKNVDELGMFQDGVVLINEIGGTILNGYQMGNEKVKESSTQLPLDGTTQI